MAKANTEHVARVSQQDPPCGQPSKNSPPNKTTKDDDIDTFSTLVHGDRDYVPQVSLPVFLVVWRRRVHPMTTVPLAPQSIRSRVIA
jgi:hypothetical protein